MHGKPTGGQPLHNACSTTARERGTASFELSTARSPIGTHSHADEVASPDCIEGCACAYSTALASASDSADLADFRPGTPTSQASLRRDTCGRDLGPLGVLHQGPRAGISTGRVLQDTPSRPGPDLCRCSIRFHNQGCGRSTKHDPDMTEPGLHLASWPMLVGSAVELGKRFGGVLGMLLLISLAVLPAYRSTPTHPESEARPRRASASAALGGAAAGVAGC
jgi:hypothetical protein